jgi:hypothetical protein
MFYTFPVPNGTLVNKWINKSIPQNYLIRNPLRGSVVLMLFCFAFLMIFRPLNPNDNKVVGYEGAMALYSFFLGLSHLGLSLFLKSFRYFSSSGPWIFKKELIIILLDLLIFGLVVYFTGMFIEINDPRFWVAMRDAALIGVVPLSVFSLINIRSLNIEYPVDPATSTEKQEPAIRIRSQLKGEDFDLIPGELVYVESNGNYVNFHLESAGLTRKITIRNTLSAVEQQLEDLPHILRTHRAFIVNMKKVWTKKGNALGYKLGCSGYEEKIPVSRSRIKECDHALTAYRHR